MQTNAPFIGRVKKGVEMSVYITEFAVIRILDAFLLQDSETEDNEKQRFFKKIEKLAGGADAPDYSLMNALTSSIDSSNAGDSPAQPKPMTIPPPAPSVVPLPPAPALVSASNFLN